MFVILKLIVFFVLIRINNQAAHLHALERLELFKSIKEEEEEKTDSRKK